MFRPAQHDSRIDEMSSKQGLVGRNAITSEELDGKLCLRAVRDAVW